MRELFKLKIIGIVAGAAAFLVTFITGFDWKSRLGNAIFTVMGAYVLYLLKRVDQSVRMYFSDSQRRAKEHDSIWKWFAKEILGKPIQKRWHNPEGIRREEDL